MYFSRSLDELHPRAAKKARQLIELCAAEDIELVVLCTYRDEEAQKALFAFGRTKPGKVVTVRNAGKSMHQFRLAFDVVPMRYGKALWSIGSDTSIKRIYYRMGELGRSVGLEWGGDALHRSMREFGHFQFLDGLTRQDVLDGKLPP